MSDAASSTTGFFQDPPRIENQFYDDIAWQRALRLFAPTEIQFQICPDLQAFGQTVLSPQVLRWAADAEDNPPHVRTWDTWGGRKDDLVTSEGWRNLQALSLQEGLVSIAYEGFNTPYHRLYQFLKTHLWSASSAGVTCPSAMQDGAAALLRRHINDNSAAGLDETKLVFKSAYDRLISRDPSAAWTSGQWMTERAGGSDVRNTETRAVFATGLSSLMPKIASDGSPLGPWKISGFKWFSSATDANMSILLAKVGPSSKLSAFFAPTRRISNNVADQSKPISSRPKTEFNGIQIQRLKKKLGTHPLPTAELVLDDMRAYLIGSVGQGTKEISTILNITRIHTAVCALGAWGRGLAVSRAFARVRRSGGMLLQDIPAHVKGLADEHVEYRGHMLMCFFLVTLLGLVEQPAGAGRLETKSAILPEPKEATSLLRLLTPVLKSQASLAAIAGLRFCMESLGGVGYLENDSPELNVARMFRDANVLSIWEGTTDVLALDTIRAIKGKDSQNIIRDFRAWIESSILGWSNAQNWLSPSFVEENFSSPIRKQVKDLFAHIESSDVQNLNYNGRAIMGSLSQIVCTVLTLEDALRDQDRVALAVANRWAGKTAATEQGPRLAPIGFFGKEWRSEADLDRSLVFSDIKENIRESACL